ncbi:hypothetical protein [Xanthocytophaga agilis]|uniref:Uncharacterized protein n=1 Tax=Xanthocytophaga agilis TaxID=3048010 RepID=A0AAE3UEX7_9BACT|nr:hypothetical protein [Xanthocytophaga agilis]MDJ1502695.1 hypothetical protein [Xanthocytophaga agilis]
MATSQIENKISKDKNILLVLQNDQDTISELQSLINTFCGKVVNSFSDDLVERNDIRLYVCGDIQKLTEKKTPLYIIKELSVHYENHTNENARIITLGEVPIIVSNAGVYFRNLFADDDYFSKIKSEHVFQELTESNKQSKALRKGIYLTKITKEESKEGNAILHYRLLRCSSNLTGPTDNFRATDHKIINLLNDLVRYVFEQETELNHVLVQIYENKRKTIDTEKEVKSKIKAHSDKTKDMPKDGLIAFCTFYDNLTSEHLKRSTTDRYDLCYKQTSALTRLHFKLKSSVSDDTLEKEFSVTLYPNSVFIIPLSTNRLYTHKIRPSTLGVDQIPTRMGYVVRCSNAEALYMNDQVYIKENIGLIKLEEMTPELQQNLKDSYYEENVSEKLIEYGKIHFSMNSGDYEKPIY